MELDGIVTKARVPAVNERMKGKIELFLGAWRDDLAMDRHKGRSIFWFAHEDVSLFFPDSHPFQLCGLFNGLIRDCCDVDGV